MWSSGIPLSSYHYAGQNGYLTQMTYGNGAYITYAYNRFEQVEAARHYNSNGTLSYTEEYQYDGNGNVSVCRVIDGASGDAVEYHYEYDSIGRLIRSTQVDGDDMVLRTEHLYDANNRLTRQAYQLGNQSFTENYTYSTADGSMTSMTTASGDKLTYTYDNLKRQSSVAAKISDTTPLYTKSYSYRSIGSDRTSMQVSSLAYSGKATNTFNYTYTADGNIKSETSGGKTRSYQYDVLGQLIKAVDGTKTYTYTYDNAGNILTACKGTTTNTYSYTNPHWADLLTAFNGQSITYDGVGNPLSYYNGTRWTFGWSNGRQLTSAQATGKNLSFTYDAGGLRTTKTVGSVTHHYTYASGRLLRETYGSNTLDFAYDAEGKPYSLTYNGNTYYYITNLQGDVVSIVNSSGTAVASYTYDPYGKVLTATGTLASINPLRYRGYYYDSETGLYYVSSRYYDPEIGRWINADSVISGSGQSVQGYNLFEYCSNNPVNKSDSTGAWPKWIKNAASTIAKIAKKAVSVVTQAANSVKSSFSPANHVQKTHVTTPTAMLNLGTLFGKVGFSSTVSKQNKEPGLVHSASDIGNDASKYSVGINIADWLGADVGVSSEINAFVSAQVTPWVHGEASFGLDGIGAVIGFDVGDTSYDFEINGGWGLIAIFVAPQIGISSGQTSGAPAY